MLRHGILDDKELSGEKYDTRATRMTMANVTKEAQEEEEEELAAYYEDLLKPTHTLEVHKFLKAFKGEIAKPTESTIEKMKETKNRLDDSSQRRVDIEDGSMYSQRSPLLGGRKDVYAKG